MRKKLKGATAAFILAAWLLISVYAGFLWGLKTKHEKV